MKQLLIISLLPIHLLAQNGVSTLVSNEQISLDEVSLEASFSEPKVSNSISVFPHVLKKNQEFVVDFNYTEGDPFEIEVRDSEGTTIEMIYSSQLSVFKAQSSITLQIHTPLEAGMYYVVLKSKKVNLGAKLIKFGGN